MDENVNVVSGNTGVENTTQAESTTVEQTGLNQDIAGENQSNAIQNEVGAKKIAQSVPYDRFAEVTRSKAELQAKYEEQARFVEALRTNPDIARQVFGSMQPQVDPQMQQVQEAISLLANNGVVTKDQLQSVLAQEFQKREEELRMKEAGQQFVSQLQSLEKKYDGNDGSPKFVPEEVARYMDSEGVTNPEKAYMLMHMDAIIDARTKGNRKAVYTERQGTPNQTVQTNDESALFEEAKRTGDVRELIRSRISGIFKPDGNVL
jgi:hypothetical protein